MAKKPHDSEIKMSSSEEALAFTRELQAQFRGARTSRAERERLRARLAEIGKDELRSIARRILVDLVRPLARVPDASDDSPRESARSTDAASGKARRAPVDDAQRPADRPAAGSKSPRPSARKKPSAQ